MRRRDWSIIVMVVLGLCLVGGGGYCRSTRINFFNDKAVESAATPTVTQPGPGEQPGTTSELNGGNNPKAGDPLSGGVPGVYSRFVVCIDPGHSSDGGDGRGRVNGTTEMDINWEVAHRLKAILEGRYGVKVILTRGERDRVVGNRQRAEVANNNHADLFFRLHCDWEASGRSTGFTFYYPDRQGMAEGGAGPPAEVIRSSQAAAKSIHAGTAGSLKTVLTDHGVKTDDSTYIGHQQQGALTGSIFSQVPVVLVEMVYLSNQRDAEFIKSQEGQEAMACALAAGIVGYLDGLR